jgi:hypothetical protein
LYTYQGGPKIELLLKKDVKNSDYNLEDLEEKVEVILETYMIFQINID